MPGNISSAFFLLIAFMCRIKDLTSFLPYSMSIYVPDKMRCRVLYVSFLLRALRVLDKMPGSI